MFNHLIIALYIYTVFVYIYARLNHTFLDLSNMQVQNSNLATVLKLQDNCTNPSIVRQLQVGEPNPSLVEKLTKSSTFVKKLSSLLKNSQARRKFHKVPRPRPYMRLKVWV